MKKIMKSCSVFHIEQMMELEKFSCFFIDFLRHSFGRIKIISTVVERDYTPDKNCQICFAYQLTDFYILRSFTERYFLTDYSYILENHFYFVNVSDYCFKPSLSRIFFLNCKNCKSIVSSMKRSFDPCISHIIALHVNCLQKERNR